MARSNADKKRALDAYIQCRTFEGASRLTDIAVNTLKRWATKYDWKERVEEYAQNQALAPLSTKEVREFASCFDIPKEEVKALEIINTVEGICLACMKDDEETVSTMIKGLKPRNFVEAVSALDKMLKARQEIIFKRNDTPGDRGGKKINYIAQQIQINEAKKEK